MSGGKLETGALVSTLKIGAATSVAGLILLAAAHFIHNPHLHLCGVLLNCLGGILVFPLAIAILFAVWLLMSHWLDDLNRKRNG